MFKVFLVLSVFANGQWQFLNSEAQPFDTIEACSAAAASFLNTVKDKDLLDDMVPAVAAECRLGVSTDGK